MHIHFPKHPAFRPKRDLLVIAMLLFSVQAFAGTSDQTFTRQVMLKAMAQNCIVPGIMDIATNADALRRTTQELMDKPSDGTLVHAQQAWVKLELAYRSNEILTRGPIEDQIFWQANFYRLTSPSLVEYMIGSNRQLDENWVQRIGAAAKGFSAMQYLLFGESAAVSDKAGTNLSASWLLEGKSAPRRRQYLYLIADDFSRNMEAAAFQAQNTNFPDTFAAGGQNSVNLLVNQLIATLEINLSLPLNFLLSPAFANKAVHGQVHSSADALMGMKATLDGLHRFYLGEVGPGLDDYVRNVNPGLSRRLEAHFQATISAWAALDQPLETMAVTEPARLKAAWEQTHKLETLLRVDLVSTMGVTIMFNSYDGD